MNTDTSKKYVITDICHPDDRFLRRIRATRDILGGIDGNFVMVKKGSLGGYVMNESNLSHEGPCWIYDNAIVKNYAKVLDSASIFGTSLMCHESIARGNAGIYDNARLKGSSVIQDNALISGNACLMDRAVLKGRASVNNECILSGDSLVDGRAGIFGDIEFCGKSRIGDEAKISGVGKFGSKEGFSDPLIYDSRNFIQVNSLEGDLSAYWTADGVQFMWRDIVFFQDNIKDALDYHEDMSPGLLEDIQMFCEAMGNRIRRHFLMYVKPEPFPG